MTSIFFQDNFFLKIIMMEKMVRGKLQQNIFCHGCRLLFLIFQNCANIFQPYLIGMMHCSTTKC